VSTKGLKNLDMGFGYSWDDVSQNWILSKTAAE
jgi:hypothetical protein